MNCQAPPSSGATLLCLIEYSFEPDNDPCFGTNCSHQRFQSVWNDKHTVVVQQIEGSIATGGVRYSQIHSRMFELYSTFEAFREVFFQVSSEQYAALSGTMGATPGYSNPGQTAV